MQDSELPSTYNRQQCTDNRFDFSGNKIRTKRRIVNTIVTVKPTWTRWMKNSEAVNQIESLGKQQMVQKHVHSSFGG
jgi:hypothetical protein